MQCRHNTSQLHCRSRFRNCSDQQPFVRRSRRRLLILLLPLAVEFNKAHTDAKLTELGAIVPKKCLREWRDIVSDGFCLREKATGWGTLTKQNIKGDVK